MDLDSHHEIYVKDLTESRETEYWNLYKALYGLKQAGQQCYNRMRTIMTITAGLTQCIGDTGCFGGPGIIVSTHVNDMAGYRTPSALAAFEKAVEQEVELEKLGKPTKLLGIELEWINGSVKLTQMDSIEKLIQEYGISTLPRHSIPQEGYAQGCNGTI